MKTVLTGKEVKELIRKAVGGIYVCKNNIPSDVFKKYIVEDDGVKCIHDCKSLELPIADDEQFNNYAIANEDAYALHGSSSKNLQAMKKSEDSSL